MGAGARSCGRASTSPSSARPTPARARSSTGSVRPPPSRDLTLPPRAALMLSTCPTAQREAAIVTAVPGTTRDVVELALDFHGFPVHVADTAGLRSTGDEVEAIGIERAVAKCVLTLLLESCSAVRAALTASATEPRRPTSSSAFFHSTSSSPRRLRRRPTPHPRPLPESTLSPSPSSTSTRSSCSTSSTPAPSHLQRRS